MATVRIIDFDLTLVNNATYKGYLSVYVTGCRPNVTAPPPTLPAGAAGTLQKNNQVTIIADPATSGLLTIQVFTDTKEAWHSSGATFAQLSLSVEAGITVNPNGGGSATKDYAGAIIVNGGGGGRIKKIEAHAMAKYFKWLRTQPKETKEDAIAIDDLETANSVFDILTNSETSAHTHDDVQNHPNKIHPKQGLEKR